MFKSPVKHHTVDVIVHKQLQPLSYDNAEGWCIGICLDVSDGIVNLFFPMSAKLLDNLVGKEGDCCNTSHLSPMLAVVCEDQVLAIASEDVEHNIARA